MADDLFGKFFIPKTQGAKSAQKEQPKPKYKDGSDNPLVKAVKTNQDATKAQAEAKYKAEQKRKANAVKDVAVRTKYGTAYSPQKGWESLTPEQKGRELSRLKKEIEDAEDNNRKSANTPASKPTVDPYQEVKPVEMPSDFQIAGDVINKSEFVSDVLDAFPVRNLAKNFDPKGEVTGKVANFAKSLQVSVDPKDYATTGLLAAGEGAIRNAINIPGQITESYANFANPKTDNVGAIQSAGEVAINAVPVAQAAKAGKVAFDAARRSGAGVAKAVGQGVGSAVMDSIGVNTPDAPVSPKVQAFQDAIQPKVVDDINYEDFYGTGNVSKTQQAPQPETMPKMETPTAPVMNDMAPGVNMTAGAIRFTDETRKQFDLPGRTKPEPQKMTQWAEEAQTVNVDELMARIDTAERPTATAPEQIALGAKMSELQDELDMLGDQYREAAKKGVIPDELDDRMDSVRSRLQKTIEASEAVGTETSRTFNARKALVKADYTVAGIIKKQVRELKKAGKKASPEDVAFAEAQANRIKELEDKLAALPQEKPTVGERRRSVRKATLEKEAESIINQIKALGEKKAPAPTMRGRQGGAINVGKIPEYVDLYAQYAANLAKRGYSTVDDIFAEVVKVAKEAGHSLSKQELVDAMDGWYLKNSGKNLSAAQQADINARAKLKKEIETGSTRGKTAATAKAQEKSAVAQQRAAELEARRAAANARREAAAAARKAKAATKAEDIRKYRAEEAAKRKEAREIMANFRATGGTAKQVAADARKATQAEYNQVFGQLNLDDNAIARLKAKKQDLDAMLKSGDFWGTGKEKATSSLSDQRDLIQFQVDQAKKQVDQHIDDIARPAWVKVARELIGIPRFLELGLDAGALMRQNWDVLFTDPRAWWRGAGVGIKATFNPRYARAIERKFAIDPEVMRMVKEGLEIDGASNHPEYFVSQSLNKIPGFGAAERFHKTSQNVARYEMGKAITKNGKLDATQRKEAFKLVNAMTGRGNAEIIKNSPILNVFTAPRMYAGQAEMMAAGFNVRKMVTNPAYRKIVLRRTLGRLGVIAGLYEAAQISGNTFGIDPDQPDFLNLTINGVQYDLGGGYTPYYRLIFRTLNDMASDKNQDGIRDLKSPDLLKNTLQMLTYKLNPAIQGTLGVAQGKDAIGTPYFRGRDGNKPTDKIDPLDIDSLLRTFAPMIGQELREMMKSEDYDRKSKTYQPGNGYKDTSVEQRAASAGLSFAGAGVKAFKPDENKKFEKSYFGELANAYGISPGQ